MELRKLGESDLEVPPVILGTWALGGWLWGGTAKNSPEDAIKASIDSGINCLDTAPAYGFGLSEELVGKAIKGRREGLIIATKCGLVWDDRPGKTHFFDTQDNDGKPLTVYRCLRKKSILAECDESLKRLGIDVIDLYQCHWPDPETGLDDTMDALQTLKDQGKIRAIGVSNFSEDQLQEAYGYVKLASDQPKYNLLTRDIEENGVLQFCRDNNIGIICYSPMEMGLLTGKISADQEFPENDTRRSRPWFEKEKRKEVLKALSELRPIAEKYDANFAQLTVAWVIHQPGITAALVGARNGEQAASNAKAANLAIAEEDIQEITAVFSELKLDEPYDPAKAKR